ncbi:hypothetical protein [Paracidovorax avenae]|uniref:hypothetical protein n=1 Tax=Paracidovorax avenae TaxID=80867 RepID=UPI0012602CE2|nr:hypothetical protein [Paracidovorax avenae]
MTSMPARMAAIALRRGSTLADPGCLADVDAERPEPGPHDLLHLVDVKHGGIAGKVDVARSMDDMAQPAREDGR